MFFFNKKSFLYLFLLVQAGCLPRLRQLSQRQITTNLEGKSTDALEISQRMKSKPKPTLYQKESKTSIHIIDERAYSGSLYLLSDERNDLFSTRANPKVGDYVTVAASNMPLNSSALQANEKDKSQPAAATANADEDLLKSMPDLAPADMHKDTLLKSFKMRINQRFANGDFLVTFERASKSDGEDHNIELRATIPYAKIVAGTDVLAEDLTNLSLDVEADGEVLHKHSSSWQDQYLLYLSGFKEAKSKMAVDLEDKRQKLLDVSGKLKDRVRMFGKERKQIAAERDKVLAENKQAKEDLEKAKAQIIQLEKEKVELMPSPTPLPTAEQSPPPKA